MFREIGNNRKLRWIPTLDLPCVRLEIQPVDVKLDNRCHGSDTRSNVTKMCKYNEMKYFVIPWASRATGGM
jgi:hypothetical protein